MGLTVVDVVGRYLLDSPVPGSFEVTELLLLVLIFAGLPLVSRADEHVSMEFIDHMLAARPRAVLERTIHLLVGVLMFFMTWQMWIKATRISSYGDATDILRIAYGPFVYFMAVMIALTGVIHLYKVFAR